VRKRKQRSGAFETPHDIEPKKARNNSIARGFQGSDVSSNEDDEDCEKDQVKARPLNQKPRSHFNYFSRVWLKSNALLGQNLWDAIPADIEVGVSAGNGLDLQFWVSS